MIERARVPQRTMMAAHAQGKYTQSVPQLSTGSGGGAANINGILYQVLRTLKTVASYSLSATTTQPLLIAEPIGGDLHVETPVVREVSQFKTKASQGTWSLATVIDEVLPDLYLAVNTSVLPTRYVFMTDGRLGRWARALEFFSDLRQRTPQRGHELDALGYTEPVRFSHEYTATERDLFLRVVNSVRTRAEESEEPAAATITAVWQLLANFHFEPLHTQQEADADISRLLRELGVAPNEVVTRRSTLIGLLTELSAKGNVSFTPAELLKKAQLSGVPLSQFERHATFSRSLFIDDIERAGFSSGSRVDREYAIPPDQRCTVFAGESGNGKSWAMAAAVERVFDHYEHLIVYVRATGDASGDFTEAAEKISREVLRRSESSSLRSLALEVQEFLPTIERLWLTICVDDVQSAQEAEGLLVADREHDRVRVVFTAPASVAGGFRHRSDLAVIDVHDFTTPELREYLENHGWDWGSVPPDIRRVIHRPLLARLFVEATGDPTWRGTTEYALYETYWSRLTIGRQADYPQDVIRLRDLCLDTAMNDQEYPWPAGVLIEYGVDDDVRRRLERTGWLRREADAGASIWHDRLLNWAVAESLVSSVRVGKSTVSEFADALAKLAPRFGSSRFGYVPMDALWLAAGDTGLSPGDLGLVLRALERSGAFMPSSLYEELIPTLGTRIVAALVDRAQDLDIEDYAYARMFSSSLQGAAGDGLPDETIRTLLSQSNPRVQDVALGYLARSPRPELIDAVWQVHIERQTLGGREWYLAYRRSYAALAAGARCDPSWLKRRVLNAAAREPVWDLAYLIAGLADEEGERFWHELKERLIAIVPLSHARSLVRCIQAYRDRDEIERLVSWLPQEKDLAGAAAFAALVHLDPERALSCLQALDLNELAFTRSWWIPWLVLAEPERGRAHIRDRIAAHPEHLRGAALLYTGHEHAIDPETLELLLQMLISRVPEYIKDADLGRPSPFDSVIRLLAKCTTLPQLRVFESHRGDPVEEQLTALAMLWIGQDYGGLDRELKHLRTVLQRFGGDGYIAFAGESLRQIQAEDYIAVLDVAAPCVASVLAELRVIVDRFIEADPSSNAHHLAFYALRFLAAAGDRNRVLDAAIKRKENIEIDIPALLAEHPPLNDSNFEMILQRIKDSSGNNRVAAVYALGMTGRPDAVSHLKSIARDSTDADTRAAALYALDALIDSDDSIDPDSFVIEAEIFPRLRALLRLGTSEALDRAEQELLAADIPSLHLLDVGGALLDSTRGPRVAAWMWPEMQKYHVTFWHSGWWKALRYLPAAREILIEHATGTHDEVRANAAAVLAEIDPAVAAGILEHAVRDYVSGHAALAETLLKTNPAEAAKFLCNHLVDESDERCRMAVGRSFRRHPGGILALLPDMFLSHDSAVRRCACEIGGWLSENPHKQDLDLRATSDASTMVQQAAIDALRRQAEFAAARELREELGNATGMRAFTYADALMETADPIVLATSDEPLCIWPAVQKQPALLQLHLEEKMNECAKAVRERAERKTRDRRSEKD